MKKIIAFLKIFFISMLILFMMTVLILGVNITKSENGGALVLNKFSCYEKVVLVSDNNDSFIHDEILVHGNQKLYTYNKLHEDRMLKHIKTKKQGIVLYFSKDFDLEYFNQRLNYNLTDKSVVQGNEIYYGFTPLYSEFYVCNGKSTNVQLVKSSNGWTLGFPIILTGF